MLLGTLSASLLRNMLARKAINRAREVAIAKRQGPGIIRAGYGNKEFEKQQQKTKIILMPPHPITNFEIQKYYQNEPRFDGVYSRDNLPKIKDGVYVIALDDYSDIATH